VVTVPETLWLADPADEGDGELVAPEGIVTVPEGLELVLPLLPTKAEELKAFVLLDCKAHEMPPMTCPM